MTYTDQPQLNPTPPRPAEVPEHESAENLSEPAVYAGAATDGAREQLATGPEGGVLARFREILLHTGDLGLTLEPGSFYWNPKGSLHGPTLAEEDTVFLEIYDGPHYPTQPEWYTDPEDAR